MGAWTRWGHLAQAVYQHSAEMNIPQTRAADIGLECRRSTVYRHLCRVWLLLFYAVFISRRPYEALRLYTNDMDIVI